MTYGALYKFTLYFTFCLAVLPPPPMKRPGHALMLAH